LICASKWACLGVLLAHLTCLSWSFRPFHGDEWMFELAEDVQFCPRCWKRRWSHPQLWRVFFDIICNPIDEDVFSHRNYRVHFVLELVGIILEVSWFLDFWWGIWKGSDPGVCCISSLKLVFLIQARSEKSFTLSFLSRILYTWFQGSTSSNPCWAGGNHYNRLLSDAYRHDFQHGIIHRRHVCIRSRYLCILNSLEELRWIQGARRIPWACLLRWMIKQFTLK